MTIERRTETIPASGQLEVAAGNLFRLITASAAVELRLESRGTSERILNVTAAIIRRVVPFDFARIIGAAGTSVQFFYGNESVDTDETDVPVSSLTITGTAATAEVPASAITNTAPVDALTAAETLLIAANVARRRVQIAADPLNAEGATTATKGGLIRGETGGNAIDDIQPGVSKWFEYTGALYVRNDSGATNRFYVREEI